MFFPYGKQSISKEDTDRVARALESDLITRGPLTEKFEKTFASIVGADFAVAFSSGSSALDAAFSILNPGPSDRVLSSPNTFIATTAFATKASAKPVFSDISPLSGNLDLSILEQHLNYPSLRGRLFVAPVHFSGIAVDMKALSQKIRGENVYVIEDAAHAIGSLYPDGERVGSSRYSDMTIFSFHPVKTITTGEGGMVTTNREDLYYRLKEFRNSGIRREFGDELPWHYTIHKTSGNYHMTEFQAALGLSQVERIDQFISKRRTLVKKYRSELQGTPHVTLFDEVFDSRTAYHLMVVQIDFQALKKTRDQVMLELKKLGIGTQLHYIPLYEHPCYKASFIDVEESFPNMQRYFKQALSLPLYFDLTEENVAWIVKTLKEVLFPGKK